MRSAQTVAKPDPAAAYRQRLRDAHARAEALAPAIAADIDLRMVDTDDRDDAIYELYLIMLDERKDETEDELCGSRMSASQDAAWLLGVAVGRRLAGRA